MKLQNLTVIFIIIILPVILVLSSYIGYELKTINLQNQYNTGVITATHDAIFSYEINSRNDNYSNNAEQKRENIKAAIKTFENSLSNACNLGLYNNEAIEEYIPAMAFCFSDGFYMYAPSEYTTIKESEEITTYKHNLRNYVYYSESIPGTDIVINYTLDNYIAVSGTIDGSYRTRAGYLINRNDLDPSIVNTKISAESSITYKGVNVNAEKITEKTNKIKEKEETEGEEEIEDNNLPISREITPIAMAYYREAYIFTEWFEKYVAKPNNISYLQVSSSDGKNDPEDENSPFVQHKREIIRKKIEETLNSSITAYSKRMGNAYNYKMPKLSAEDWEKIYNNISFISFVQGINVGFKKYNNYCVLSSTNNQEFVNPNLIYFVDDGDNNDSNGEYHDIRCKELENKEDEIVGYKIGSFEKQTYESKDGKRHYYYKHLETACYSCINGTNITEQSIYNYVRDTNQTKIKKAYFSALARERYKTVKLLKNQYNPVETYKIVYDKGADDDITNMPETQIANVGESTVIASEIPQRSGWNFMGWAIDNNEENIVQPGYDQYVGWENIRLVAIWKRAMITIKIYDADNESLLRTIKYNPQIISNAAIITVSPKIGHSVAIYDTITPTGDAYNYYGKPCTEVSQDMKLYAKYTKNKYRIIYTYPDGTQSSAQEYEYGSVHTIESGPTISSNYFLGWRVGSKDYYPGQTVTITGDMNFSSIIQELPDELVINSNHTIVDNLYISVDKLKLKPKNTVNSSNARYLELYIDNTKENSITPSRWTIEEETVETIEFDYYFKLKNVQGTNLATSSSKHFKIIVDRKAPVLSDPKRWTTEENTGLFGTIKKTVYHVSIKAVDSDSGILINRNFGSFAPRITYGSDYLMNEREEGVFTASPFTPNDYKDFKITVKDRCGNTATYTYKNSNGTYNRTYP